MVKILGALFIISSIAALIFGAYIDIHYGAGSQVTGNLIKEIVTQPSVSVNFFEYVEAGAFAYCVLSFIVGAVLLYRF
ncbi:MAG TPA: hypothetical protein VI564_06250 [Candidatus Nanoarchaeia archaeon]|nr:hypothetical protein [Candidatus Nanoarchaeia archaeon]